MLIREITLRGILSFGPDSPPIEMRPLNVLIGPNGSGKSNLLEALGLLRSAPTKLAAPLRGAGGGVTEWIWKGASDGKAHLEVVVEGLGSTPQIRHVIEFLDASERFRLADETIEDILPRETGHYLYQFQNGRPILVNHDEQKQMLSPGDIALDESILSQRKDPYYYPELGDLAQAYSKIRLYREWSFGRSSIFRSPQSADLPGDRLEEDFSNLGLFLNYLRNVPRAKNMIIDRLRDLYEGLDDFDVRIKGGTVEVVLTEGNFVIPANRLSDGTLRYLCLLAILCDPEPPPLICIEEPELGLHPDILPKIADLLVDASQRTQVVVTTHSDVLVDALTEHPESIVVFEKHEGQTKAQRLDAAELAEWLAKYRLGQLWTRGQIGGTRW